MADKLWGGRFKEKTSGLVEKFTESVSFDKRLYRQDIDGSIAHAQMLGRCGIITKAEADKIIKGLNAIKADIEKGRFVFDEKLEDVHMNIESELAKRIGKAGKKLHTARSRNDQVATDLRLYVRGELESIASLIVEFMAVLLNKAEENIAVIIPGTTHLQNAQPVSFAHHLLAYFEMLNRDFGRIIDCIMRLNVLPLGSAALAGTPHPIDRKMTAAALSFDSVCANSIDAVSDRDFAIEAVSALSILMMHLSRLAEEIIIWNTQAFSLIELPDAFCTGSSIMPQKKNPDVAELVRGKTGRVYGSLVNLLTIMKGLPLAYNRDMQEDKQPIFDSLDTAANCIEVMIGLVKGMEIKKDSANALLKKGFITATDLADYLATKGVPFREAHRVTGELVAYCIKNDRTLDELSLDIFRKFSDKFSKDVVNFISAEGSADRKTSLGGTARKNVKAAIVEAKKFMRRLAS